MKNTLKAFLAEGRIEAGCDEAGRGCLAGPVCAAAVILPADFSHPLLNDSKQMSRKNRDILREVIEREAISCATAFVSPQEIDRINILQASIEAMHRALDRLGTVPGAILVDGNRFRPYRGIEYHCIVKGDAKFASIAAASVLAKTYRDEYMEQLAARYPGYNWESNMGYPTKEHREAIRRLGPTEHHRKTFRLLEDNDRDLFSDCL